MWCQEFPNLPKNKKWNPLLTLRNTEHNRSAATKISLSISLSLTMQRQSLGSPVSKLHIHGGGGGGGSSKEDLRLTELHPSFSSSSSTSPTVYDDDDDESKTTKPRRFSLSPPPLALSSSLSTHSRPEKLIHLIPLLTLFCFLVLYFSSHSPSPSGRCTYSLVSFFIFHFFCFLWSSPLRLCFRFGSVSCIPAAFKPERYNAAFLLNLPPFCFLQVFFPFLYIY